MRGDPEGESPLCNGAADTAGGGADENVEDDEDEDEGEEPIWDGGRWGVKW